MSIDRIRDWSCFDIDTDQAVGFREYHIPIFWNWTAHGAFEPSVTALFRTR